MKKTGIDLEKLKYPNNGLYTFCCELGNRLPALCLPDEELHYYLPKGFNKLSNSAFHAHPLHWYHRYLFSFPKVDVWHATHQDPNVFPSKQARGIVLTIHDLNFLFDEKISVAKQQALLHKQQTQLDQADIITFISRFALTTVQKHLKVSPSKCRVIHNGADIKEFPGFDQPAYRPAGPFLFAVGTVMKKKNFHVLPALLQHNDFELIIAGQQYGDYVKEIEKAAADFGVQQRVRLLGNITAQDKYWYYKNCTAFLFPSLAEGFGLPAIEAMHFGKPVFLSDKTSLPEVGGDAAYYFHDFDPEYMQEVLKEGLAHFTDTQKAEAVKQHATQFSWDKAAAAYMQAYRELY